MALPYQSQSHNHPHGPSITSVSARYQRQTNRHTAYKGEEGGEDSQLPPPPPPSAITLTARNSTNTNHPGPVVYSTAPCGWGRLLPPPPPPACKRRGHPNQRQPLQQFYAATSAGEERRSGDWRASLLGRIDGSQKPRLGVAPLKYTLACLPQVISIPRDSVGK